MLQLNNLQKKFRKKVVLDDINFTFERKVYGLLGPNGAGKTTLIRCVTNLYGDYEGTISYQGVPIARNRAYFTKMGYLPQKFGVFHDLSVHDIMRYFAYQKGMAKQEMEPMILHSLETIHLADCLKQKAGTLSGGMLRRLGIAQAILNEPDVVIFDEPTSGLDPEERIRFKNIISQIKKDRTVLISTHIVEDIEAVCDEILILGGGRLCAHGTSAEIRALAQGKVYEIAENEQELLAVPFYLQRRYEENGTVFLRVLSAAPQAHARGVQPSVEDGYICCLKNI